MLTSAFACALYTTLATLPVGPQVFCETFADGDFVALDLDGDDASLCRLDAARVGAATLLRVGEQARRTQAIDAFFAVGAHRQEGHALLPNPASTFCIRQGGRSKAIADDAGALGLCCFDDGSLIEEWTLLRGAHDPANRRLADFIRNYKGTYP